MSDGSTIEWLQRPGTKPATWNPIRAGVDDEWPVGWHCEHVHEGCRHCYAERMNVDRFGTGLPYARQSRDRVKVFLDERVLLQPLHWKSPRTIFVCSMTDAMGAWVTDAMLDRIFAVAALSPQHTFIVLTKRPERMRVYLTGKSRLPDAVIDQARALQQHVPERRRDWQYAMPLPNVWGLVSCSTQDDADAFIPILLQTPLAVRGVSAEPLLGPIDLTAIRRTRAEGFMRPLDGRFNRLDWVICGGESGQGARPMSIQWARELRDQCVASGVAFFFKQWGEWRPAGLHQSEAPGRFAFGDYEHDRTAMVQVDHYPRQFTKFGARSVLERVGKKAAGRLLDGVTHDGYPQGSPA